MKIKNETERSLNRKKTSAFTLAEVLITLGIIGVVASITIPVINKSIEKTERKSKVKKAYSTIINATNAIKQENGGDMKMNVDGLTGTSGNDYPLISTYYKNQYKKYIKFIQDCDIKSQCQGQLWPMDTDWYDNNGTKMSEQAGGYGAYASILGADGTTYRFYVFSNTCNYNSTTTCGYVYFDINGMKKPNKLDEDIHWLLIRENAVIPAHQNAFNDNILK